ncbi:beta-lactamase/transpeptidase-like protein [Crepidotus variabilis]|uniref:Beta-lactamase/transpeptidase-like protein n=1 Tax=Crepidotus variabilis TaxID=179855 RepID=A0A9P6E8L6_9AGAR|nr:beta-lactamase/transpeptidase-like protein [Crepidotus variabilis]
MRITNLWLQLASISLSAFVPFTLSIELSNSISQSPFGASENHLISSETRSYAQDLVKRWNTPGLSIAAVKRDASQPSGWNHEFASFGIARADGSPITPDTVFAIGSNSKLFLAVSIGLLVHNGSLTDLKGRRLSWQTKVKDVVPGWGLMDKDAESGSTIQDLLSHRTGLPRHEFSYKLKDGHFSDVISTLRHLRPSAEFRETYQYNNLMYTVLSYLPTVLLNQTYASYVSQHIFRPLNMSASTFSVAEAEQSGLFADGFQYDLVDLPNGKNGTLKPIVPFFIPKGHEEILAGGGGVLSSARDLALWVSMFLNEGKHPYANVTIVPKQVIEHIAHGRSVADGGKPMFPELSPKVYGAGQARYSYRGREIVEHGGAIPGFKTGIARFPQDQFGVISLSNDDNGGFITESVKWRVVDDVLGLERVDWNSRYEKIWSDYLENVQKHTPRPAHPQISIASLVSLAKDTFNHPMYGTFRPCLVPGSQVLLSFTQSSFALPEQPHCRGFLASPPTQRLLSTTNLASPTFLIPFGSGIATHLVLEHFDGNIFNLTAVWTNWASRQEYINIRTRKHGSSRLENLTSVDRERDEGDLITRWPETFEVEWVDNGSTERGLAFRGGFWGKEGPDSRNPGGTGSTAKEGAEVWFRKVELK